MSVLIKSKCLECMWHYCSWYLARESSTKGNFTPNPERWKKGEKMEKVDETSFTPNSSRTITSLKLISTHLGSSTFVLPRSTMCFWNEVQGFPVYDGNTADCRREGSSAAASRSCCERLRESIQPEQIVSKKCTATYIEQTPCNMSSSFNMWTSFCLGNMIPD